MRRRPRPGCRVRRPEVCLTHDRTCAPRLCKSAGRRHTMLPDSARLPHGHTVSQARSWRGARGRPTRSSTRRRRSKGSTCSPATVRWSRRAARGRRLGASSAPRRWAASSAASRSSRGGAWPTRTSRCCARFDRYGHRIDEVEFHPAWHQLMTLGVENELHSLPWTSAEPLAHTRARRALHDRDAGRGRLRLPDHDDLRGRARAARAARAGGRVGAAGDRHHLRPAADRGEREGLGDLRHGDDREAGRLRRARQHHRRAGR